MRIKAMPTIGARYWFAMAIASMCGANLGDIVMDVLKLPPVSGFALLALLFAALFAIERTTTTPHEGFYWGAILILRATATNIADFTIKDAGFGYISPSLILMLILVALIMLARGTNIGERNGKITTDWAYWLTMLVAGTLGTLIADGMGHAFGAVQRGVPIAGVMATLTVFALMEIRRRPGGTGVVSYWLALVAIRWWGTNIGDISAYLVSLPGSTIATGLALIGLLMGWRERRADGVKARAG